LKRDLLITVVAVIIIIAICFGLRAIHPNLTPPAGQSAAEATSSSAPSSSSPTATTAGNGAGAQVVMRVNGQPVTEREFELFLAAAPQQLQQVYASPQGRTMAAQELVKMKVLEQEGDRRGYDKDPQIAAQLGWAKANLTAAHTLQELAPNPSDAEIRAFYDKEKARFTQLQLSHILVAVEGGPVKARSGKTPTPEQGMQKAAMLAQQLKGGADFATLAKQYSDDPQSAERGGDVGQVAAEALPPEIQPVMGLKSGEVSQPIRSSMGIHIFKAGARTVAPFEQVKPFIAQQLRQQKAAAETERLSKTAKVELDPKFFPAPKASPQGADGVRP
jgi:parvulin-like peptidyl-prolyl isomerase